MRPGASLGVFREKNLAFRVSSGLTYCVQLDTVDLSCGTVWLAVFTYQIEVI